MAIIVESSPMARPQKDIADKRTSTLRIRLSPREEARFLTRAAEARAEPSAYARALLCSDMSKPPANSDHHDDFTQTDALLRIGTDLQRLASIAERTGQMPEGLGALLVRIERLLDKAFAS